MLKNIRQTIILLSITLLASCNDTFLPELEEGTLDSSLDAADIRLNGLDQNVSLPESFGNVSQIIATKGSFITALGGNQFFVEQNDGSNARTTDLTVIDTNGQSHTCRVRQDPVSLVRQTDLYNNFYRNYGVGYSYNAVDGEYCNLSDVRCQLINRAVLDRLQPNYPDIFMLVDQMNDTFIRQSVSTSVTNYIQNTNFKATAKGQLLLLFSGGIEKSCHIFEDGITNQYLLHQEQLIKRAEFFLDPVAVAEAVQIDSTILTASFRSAINKLAQTDADDWQAVDDFINLYGTHVVTNATLGAKLALDIQVEEKKFHTLEEVNELSKASIALLFKRYSESQSSDEDYKILKDSKCQIDVLGGDLSTLDNLINTTIFRNDNYTPTMFNDWVESVNFDNEHIENSNVELMDMNVTPIWDLIPDPSVAERVEARVVGNVNIMQKYLGNRNFINTSFSINPSGIKFLAAGKSATAASAPIVNVIASNRVVAIICKEYVPEIGGAAYKKELKTVAYPVYEGRVQMKNGLCIFMGQAYDVSWNDDHFSVDSIGPVKDENTIYMNLGKLEINQYANLTYQPSSVIPALECINGIRPDGSVKPDKYCSVIKHFGDFYLGNVSVVDNAFDITFTPDFNSYENIPNWTWTTQAPAYSSGYPEFFDTGSDSDNRFYNRMVRSDDYLYIYNPTEISAPN